MKVFEFKDFRLCQAYGVMPLTTDAIVLGTWSKVVGTEILDVGTGTGILSLMLANRHNDVNILAIDNCSHSILFTKKNVNNSPFRNIRVQMRDFFELEEKRFHHIISNPPFFKNSLQSKDTFKNSSKHYSKGLSPETLLEKASELLLQEGVVSLIVQSGREDELIFLAKNRGLQCIRMAYLKHQPSRKAHRVLMEFKLIKAQINFECEEIIIRGESGEYTHQFINLTREFYTIF